MLINYYKLGLVAAFLAATFYFIHIQREIGEDRALDKLKRENENASEQANQSESDLLKCINTSGVYDFSTGKCAGSKTSYWSIPDWIYGQDHSGPKQD